MLARPSSLVKFHRLQPAAAALQAPAAAVLQAVAALQAAAVLQAPAAAHQAVLQKVTLIAITTSQWLGRVELQSLAKKTPKYVNTSAI